MPWIINDMYILKRYYVIINIKYKKVMYLHILIGTTLLKDIIYAEYIYCYQKAKTPYYNRGI